MKTFLASTMALAVALGASGPVRSNEAPKPHPAMTRHVAPYPDFVRATALAHTPGTGSAPSVSPAETDGLGRNDGDCVMGCVDH